MFCITNLISVALIGVSSTENATEGATQQSGGDLGMLLDNANIPVLCLIIGAAIIIFTFFSHRASTGNADAEEYNEKSYYKYHNFEDEED